MPELRPLTALAAAATLAACGDPFDGSHDEPLTRDMFSLDWSDGPTDAIVFAAMSTPHNLEAGLASPMVCVPYRVPAVELVDLRAADRALALRAMDSGCYAVVRDDAHPLAPGDHLAVGLRGHDGERATFDAVVPDLPSPLAHHALAALRTPDGTTWLATVHHGLLGVTVGGRTVQYRGVSTTASWDPTAAGPQSDLLLALEPSGERAMWLATAATGVSWFDPGADPLDRGDDTWVHGQPLPAADPSRPTPPPLAAELAQTALALAPDPRDPTGLWVATLNGLFHARREASSIVFTRVADGPALAVAVDDQGLVWAGFSTQAVFTVPAAADGAVGPDATVTLPPAEGALLVLDPGADPDVATDDHLVWSMPDEDAVTALLPQLGRTWVGTPYGLVRAAYRGDRLSFEPAPAAVALGDTAVTALAPSRDGLWIAARAECAVDSGRLLRAHVDVLGDIVAVDDLSQAGFGERDFASVRELTTGEVIVSTLVPALSRGLFPTAAEATARGCAAPAIEARTADLYTLAPDGGPARRFGAR